jgi:sphingolipid delta-4 desaturase
MSPSARFGAGKKKAAARFASTSAPTDFSWSTSDEPHATRRKVILEAHPEIRTLFGPEIRTLPITVAVVAFQICMAYIFTDLSWPWLVLVTYVISATANHCLMMISHELSHNLCFHTPEYNQLLAIFSNIATGIPSAITFKRYHMEHHQFQGVDSMDLDLPTWTEAMTVGTNTVLKIIWVSLQSLFYSLRPIFVKPKPAGKWELFNIVVQLSFDAVVVYFLGWKSLFYLVFGTIMAVGLHPSGGHFIAEHYEFVKGAETYSYYGPMNYVNMNVGYHNEHHDFPKIAWSRLPQVRRMAPEFYETLPRHESYLRVFWDYITDPTLGPFSRIRRKLPRGLSACKGT